MLLVEPTASSSFARNPEDNSVRFDNLLSTEDDDDDIPIKYSHHDQVETYMKEPGGSICLNDDNLNVSSKSTFHST